MSELATKASASDWEKIELGEVLTLNYGKALPKAERNPSGQIPVYGANGIKDYADQALSNGPTLIIGRKGSAGQITRVDGDFWPLDVTYFTSHDQNRIDFDYLAYALSMLDLPSLARGVKPGINRDDVYALEILMPSTLDEQKRIVAVLDQAFTALDRARDCAEANLSNSQALYDSVIEKIFSVRPTWPSEDLSKRVRFLDYRGKTPPKSDNGIPLITAKNVRLGFIKNDPEEFVEESAYEKWMTRGFPEVGDVLFTTEAPLANVARLETSGKVVIGQRLITMQTDRAEIDPSFLKWSLLSPQMQTDIHAQATGATVLGIKAKLLKKIPLHVPASIDVQKALASACEATFANRVELERLYAKKLENISALRQGLLEKAFAGELI